MLGWTTPQPLNFLRTRESIPFCFLQFSCTQNGRVTRLAAVDSLHFPPQCTSPAAPSQGWNSLKHSDNEARPSDACCSVFLMLFELWAVLATASPSQRPWRQAGRLTLTAIFLSCWCRLNFFVYFLTIFGFSSGGTILPAPAIPIRSVFGGTSKFHTALRPPLLPVLPCQLL